VLTVTVAKQELTVEHTHARTHGMNGRTLLVLLDTDNGGKRKYYQIITTQHGGNSKRLVTWVLPM